MKPPPGPHQKKLWNHKYGAQANYDIHPTFIEIEVHPHTAKARQRSANKYNKRHTIEAFSPGDVVSIRVPREDRTATDPYRIFCRVLAVPHHNRYKLQTAHEVLNIHYPVAVINRVPPEACLDAAANIPETELPNIITLHAASAKMSTSERIPVSCNYKPPRCTGKCRCLKNEVNCFVHCHATESDCHNLSELAIRTEVALVDRGMKEDEQFPEEEQLQEEKQPREEEKPQEQDYGLSAIQDSNDSPLPSRMRTRQATPATAPERTAGGRVLRKRRRRVQ